MDIFGFFSLLNSYAAVTISFLRENWISVVQNVIASVVLISIGFAGRSGIISFRYIRSRFGKDLYSSVYGHWFGYRIYKKPGSRHTEVFEVDYYIKKTTSAFPRCILKTKYMHDTNEPTVVHGQCRIVDNKLAIELFNTKQPDRIFVGPSVAWFIHRGSTDFVNVKMGKLIGIASSSDVVCGDVIISRDQIPVSTILEAIEPFDRLSVLNARTIVGRITGSPPQI